MSRQAVGKQQPAEAAIRQRLVYQLDSIKLNRVLVLT